jgi:hypothetical protein
MYHRDVTETWNGPAQCTPILVIKVIVDEAYEDVRLSGHLCSD